MRVSATHLSKKKISLKVPDISSFFLYAFSNWEPDVKYFIDHFIGNGDVIEVGAHIGYETLYMAKRIEKNRKIIAFEPSPRTLLFLKENCKNSNNIEVVAKAVSDESGVTNILSFRIFSAWNTLGHKARFPQFIEKLLSPKNHIVGKVTIDEFTFSRKYLNPSFIKIDAENFEYHVLKGAQDTIQKFKPVITFEGGDLNRDPKYSTENVIDLLKQYNYKLYTYNKKSKNITTKLPQNFSKCINILALPV